VLWVSVSYNFAIWIASEQSLSWDFQFSWAYQFLNTSMSTLLLLVTVQFTLVRDGYVKISHVIYGFLISGVCLEADGPRFLLQFNDIINVIFSSKPFVAGFVAFFLDNTLHRHDNATRKDRGYHWWDKFRSFRTDTRSEEFYSLPFNLNKFFPSVWVCRLGNVSAVCVPTRVPVGC